MAFGVSTDIGIDLGTASILVYIKGKGVVLKEPSVVAYDRNTNEIKAIGEEARMMIGRTPGNIVAIRPLKQGVIADYTITEKMIRYFIQKAIGKRTFRKPRICVCVPSQITEVVPRATFTPRELAELTIGFYKRNYIEGLFLSSAVIGTPDYTMERMIEALRILRQEYHFNGYIHAKTIPGADAELVRRIGLLADRLSVNIELPSEASLSLLAPDKKKQAILKPMGQIAVQSAQSKKELVLYRHAPAFAPAGQSTQMIIGATPESGL